MDQRELPMPKREPWYTVEEVRYWLERGGRHLLGSEMSGDDPPADLVPHADWICEHLNRAFNKGHHIGTSDTKNTVAAFFNGSIGEDELAKQLGLFNHRGK